MKKFLLGVFIVLVVAFIGLNYYAAQRTENKIDRTLQIASEQSGDAFTINYSSIDVAPFKGNLHFKDLNYIRSSTITRAASLTFDLGYLDFLRFILSNNYGLNNIHDIDIHARKPSVVYRANNREIKAYNLDVFYSGDLKDILQHHIKHQPFRYAHKLSAEGDSLFVGTSQGSIKADSLKMHTGLPAQSSTVLQTRNFELKATGLHWNPSENIKNQYGFLIRGFNYAPDNIPADSLLLTATVPQRSSTKQVDLNFYTNLFHARADAELRINDQSPLRSRFQNGKLKIVDITKRFKDFLGNIEKLFGINIPVKSRTIMTFKGPLTSPDFTFTGSNQPADSSSSAHF